MTQRQHRMPFGATVLADKSVCFRLWAPGAKQVTLCLEGGEPETLLPMQKEQDGWFALTTDRAKPGSLYRYQIDDGLRVPDPASRFQPQDVHGPSQVIDPLAWHWQDDSWQGRPWEEAIFYETHVGTFTGEGTLAAVKERLDYLVDLGVTALEIMPIADFPGSRNWGYDGVLPFAPESRYGGPDGLKDLVQSAHAKGLMVFLDVIYNHFGPDGNYLHLYAPAFFTDRHKTPWGAAINFDDEGSHWVRQFFIHNALYWLEEYHLDGLRLDAVHAILDDSRPDILEELADRVQQSIDSSRRIHLVLENDNNAAHYLARDPQTRQVQRYVAQWNDDFHHVLHVLTTDEKSGYYRDYADRTMQHLARCLGEGFAYQGDPSPYREGRARGEPSADLPLTAFVNFLQNHDQVGNRAFGDRLSTLTSAEALRAATALFLLAPSPPLLFMGQEWACRQPFLFFCDFEPDLAVKVTEGRRREFAGFPEFSDPKAREKIPDPALEKTYRQSILDWSALQTEEARQWLELHRHLLALRRREIAPRLSGIQGGSARASSLGERGLKVEWRLADAARLILLANLGAGAIDKVEMPAGRVLYVTTDDVIAQWQQQRLPGWSVAWLIQEEPGHGQA